MVRSAYLPEDNVLSSLFDQVRGERSGGAKLRGNALSERAVERGLNLTELDLALSATSSVDARFKAFQGWLERGTSALGVFVADSEGLSMFESGVREGYVAAAAELGGLLSRLAAVLPEMDEGSTTLRLRSGALVELVACRTELGRFTVGLLLERALGAEQIVAVRTGFAAAAGAATTMGREV